MGKKKTRRQKVTSGKLVVKDNKLINARYNLSVSETRLFLSMITQIQKDDKDFKTYRIQVGDFVDTIGTTSKNIYERAKETSKRMMEKVLEIEEEDGPLQVTLLSSAKYYSGKGYVDLRFDPALKPYLLQLREKFTAYDIRNVLQLRSSHSIRIYELLKQYENIGERSFFVEELKELLGVADQYSRYNDFKRFVLFQAEKDINQNCDISFTFEERRKGRKIEKIVFFITPGKAPALPANDSAPEETSDIVHELRRMGLSPSQIKSITRKKPEAAIRKAIEYTQTRYHATKGSDKEIQNIPGYLLKVLESQTGEQVAFAFEAEKKEEEAQKRLDKEKKLAEEKKRQAWQLEKLKLAYQDARRALYIKRAPEATENDWEAFEAHVRDNPYMTKKFVAGGVLNREHDDIPFWLGSYLVEREWPDTPQTFIEWCSKTHGVDLEHKVGDEYLIK